jgi:hypothetical protein
MRAEQQHGQRQQGQADGNHQIAVGGLGVLLLHDGLGVLAHRVSTVGVKVISL